MLDIDLPWGIFQRLEPTDAVEILIIGIAVAAVMRFLKGTRGARLLRGLVLLLVGSTLVLYLVANRLNLERIEVLYPPFVGAMFLVALVAFQPELRRALIRLGATGWFAEPTQRVDHVIEEAVTAAAYMSKNKIGALIAFERATELGGLIESGCRVDAEVSAPLLNTIFWPGSALHDLGVIVSQGRVAAAAVQFPLTDAADVEATMGSRHRAALGLSEETDALILVISEETGIISVAEQGQLHRFLTPDSLRHMLRTKMSQQVPEEV
jgi:diadenylate cyclase